MWRSLHSSVVARVTTELYERMWTAYKDRQSIRHVAEACDVHQATAKRYVEVGDLDRGWKPLKERYASQTVTQDKAAARALAYTLAGAQENTLKLTQRMKKLAFDAMLAMQGTNVRNPERWAEIAWKIETAVLGGAHMNVNVKGGLGAAQADANDPCAGMDDDEQIEFLELALGVFRQSQIGLPSTDEGLASHIVH